MKNKKWPDTLGDTPDEIAATLLAQGVRGVPKRSRQCIIAMSYKCTYPGGWSGLRASYDIGRRADGSLWFVCSLTFNDCQITDPTGSAALAQFMYKFDNGEYPELINKPIPTKAEVLSKLSVEERIALHV